MNHEATERQRRLAPCAPFADDARYPELARVTSRWFELPAEVRATILALIDAADAERGPR